MKKRKLNKRGKILVTILTIIFSVIIYGLVAQFGELASKGIIYQILLISGWGWLLLGQMGVYMTIWE